jgi:hypothetical protein
MSIIEDREKALEEDGWTVECESPLEIRHKDGGFAREYAAILVKAALWEEKQDEEAIHISGNMTAEELEVIVKAFYKKLPRRIVITNHAGDEE